MKHNFVRTTGAIALLLAGSALAGPPVVNPEQMDMGVEINAKIGKEKSKRNSLLDSNKQASDSGGGKGDCGSVNINSNENKSNSGIKGMFGKQSTTIVTGPVINMASCK